MKLKNNNNNSKQIKSNKKIGLQSTFFNYNI